jgi:hypothetical protein
VSGYWLRADAQTQGEAQLVLLQLSLHGRAF